MLVSLTPYDAEKSVPRRGIASISGATGMAANSDIALRQNPSKSSGCETAGA